MAVAIPVVLAWAGAASAVTAAVAGAATFAGFLSIAGASLVTVGALTKNSDLTKIGGFMSLAGGLGSAISKASAAGAAADASGAAVGGEAAAGAAAAEAAPVQSWQSGNAFTSLGDASAMPAYDAPNLNIGGAAEISAPAWDANSLMQSASQSAGGSQIGFGYDVGAGATGGLATPSQLTSDPLAMGAKSMTSPQLQQLLKTAQEKAAAAARGFGPFVKENKELMQLGGGILKDMYGPEAEYLSQRQSIYERQRANMNSPVRLGIVKPQ